MRSVAGKGRRGGRRPTQGCSTLERATVESEKATSAPSAIQPRSCSWPGIVAIAEATTRGRDANWLARPLC